MKIERRKIMNMNKSSNKILRYESIKEGKEVKIKGLEFDDSVGEMVVKNQKGIRILCGLTDTNWRDGMLIYSYLEDAPLYYYRGRGKGKEKIYLKYRDIKRVRFDSEEKLLLYGEIAEVSEDGRLVYIKVRGVSGKIIYFASYDYIKELKCIRMEDICQWNFLANWGGEGGLKGENNIVLTMGWCYSPKTNIDHEIRMLDKVVDVLGIKRCLVIRKEGLWKINDYEKEVIGKCYKWGVKVIEEIGKANREGKIEKRIDSSSEI